MGLALGLGAAASWGVADCLVAYAARRAGARVVALGFHLAALIPLVALTAATGGFSSVPAGEFLGFAGLGLVGWLAYVTFYSALAIGPVSLISPVVSGYAAITVLFAVVLGGEVLSAPAITAVVLTIAGVTIAGLDAQANARIHAGAVRGLALGLVAMLLFGGFVYGVSYQRAGVTWLAAICLARAFSALFLLLAERGKLSVPEGLPGLSRLTLGAIVLIGVLDTAGYVCFSVGVRHAGTAIVATASAPYALVPVVVGVRLLRERPSRAQWVGLSAVGAGLLLLGATS